MTKIALKTEETLDYASLLEKQSELLQKTLQKQFVCQ